ncbi:hypothetical protein Dxin01_00713 [Deinococcus xinjiangensis]|uniref:DinB-like domain-containing protein n=1 Tax=Deinococcus xinjiangensis TaxID=457454 RepID=A0ABP9V6S3_9DEIO
MGEEASHARAGEGSSLNWVLGHVLSSRGRILHMLGGDLGGLDVPHIRSMYESKTRPDPTHALPTADLLTKLEATQPALASAIDAADLSAEIESPFGKQPLGDLLNFFAWHEGYPAGQTAIFKRLAESA